MIFRERREIREIEELRELFGVEASRDTSLNFESEAERERRAFPPVDDPEEAERIAMIEG